jgi:hypothetical protein
MLKILILHEREPNRRSHTLDVDILTISQAGFCDNKLGLSCIIKIHT